MKRWLARRILAGLLLLGSVALAGGFWIDHSLAMAKDDAYIIDALGRQRMLSQAMGKSILSYAMARSSYQVVENQTRTLDHYIDAMRKVYTSLVIPPRRTGWPGPQHFFRGTGEKRSLSGYLYLSGQRGFWQSDDGLVPGHPVPQSGQP